LAQIMSPLTKSNVAEKKAKPVGRFEGFGPPAFRFLKGLKRNNTREWFEAHREDYDTELREPMIALIDELGGILPDIAPELRADRKKSMFRIHRDVRFSKNRQPYKTNAACWLFSAARAEGERDAHGGPGFYINVEPGSCMVGGGIWMPSSPALKRIRARIADDPKSFERVINDRAFVRRFGALGEEAMLSRLPRGFEPDHPAAGWLRYKSFTAKRMLADGDVGSRQFIKTVATDIEIMRPFIVWIGNAVSLGF
jgi:uncharacterized protein (TIGR02453 family)